MAFPFSDTTNRTGIVEDIDFLCDTDATSYPLVDKARNVNRWLYRMVTWMFQSSPFWSFDDSNLTTTPIAKTNLVNNQEDYSLPLEMLGLQKVGVLDSSGVEHEVYPVTLDEFKRRTSGSSRSTGIPSVYCLRGNSLLLDSLPDTSKVTATNGLLLYITREASMFVAGDTTKEAGIPEPFCRVLSIGPSGDFWLKYDVNKARELYGQISEMKKELMSFNENRVEDITPRVRVPHNTRQYT